jgi:leader peptidase (prepilin peptidase)/N-methyltransferase
MVAGLAAALALVVGLAVGSFLNVVRYRLPRGLGMVAGRSMCPNCGRTIAWYDNLPLVSFAVLRGRCRACGWKIPWTYPVVEAATGLAFLGVWLVSPPAEIPGHLVLAALVIASAGIDFDLRIIPDKLTLPGIVVGIIFSLTLAHRGTLAASLAHTALGLVVGGGSLLAIALAYKAVRRIEGMGGGDIKMMAMVGAFLGWKLALVTIFLGAFAGGLVGLGLARKSPQGMKAAVPFGVFLAPGAIVAMLWGDALIDQYLRLIGR